MDVSFPFENIGRSSFGQVWQPVAKVVLKSPSVPMKVSLWMVVDTGADYTVIPRHFSEKLRVSLERDCVKDTTFGVGGEQTVYFLKEKIQAEIGKFKRNIPLAFFDNNEVPALLGRLGFLETFDVEFFKNRLVNFKA